jgi:hydrogenase maturation protease
VSRRILVAGLGNVLMSDDAIGPYCAAHLLAHYEFPAEVEVADLGAPGLDLTLHLASADVVIAVDAIRGVEPGTLRVFTREALLDGAFGTRLDTHAPALAESMALAELVREQPLDAVLIGLGGCSFEHGTMLSPIVRGRIGALADAVLKTLSDHGAGWHRRDSPDPDQPWWERPVLT